VKLEARDVPSSANILTESFEIPIRNDLVIFDTTLRDGEQTPGVTFTSDEKLEIATALDALGVHIASVGMPVISPAEFATVKRIATAGLKMQTAALCRLAERDIDRTIESGVQWIGLFIGGSHTHLEEKLRMTEAQATAQVEKLVAYTKTSGRAVIFAVEDGSRTPMPRLIRMLSAAEAAGADYIVFTDTAGVLTPVSTFMIIRTLASVLKVPLGLHFHNDLGLAQANNLAGLQAGAKMAQLSVNGLGERAGNASLEELLVALRVKWGIDLGLRLDKLHDLSMLVHRAAGTTPPANKGVTGKWAFTHESGIHVAGLLTNPETYQPYPPAMVGRSHEIVFGKHSGKHGLVYLAERHGIKLSDEACQAVLARIKEHGEKKAFGPIPDETILEWIRAEAGQ
jgi:isopropylmalate/homocitrate/citramalate synthase